jgi:hypothetical protein
MRIPHFLSGAARRCSHGPVLIILAAVLMPVAPVQAAPKTDIIVFHNGDRLTGEIKGLERGQLELSTSSAGTVNIEWDKVASVETTQYLDVETVNGSRFFGKAPRGEAAGTMRVIVDGEPEGQVLRMTDVVRIAPIDQGGLIKRLDGYVTAGLSLAKADNETQLDFSGGLNSRNEKREWSIDGQTTINSESNDRTTSAYDVTVSNRRFLRDRWFLQGFGTVQGNDELGLNIREVLGYGFGRYLVQGPRNEWAAFVGLAGVRENFQKQDNRNSLEGVIGTQYSYFRYDTPKRSLDLGLAVFPSLTQSGRVRAEADVTSRFELVEDLFFDVSAYGSYDSEADPSAPSNTDYGLVTSLGYSF